MVTIVDDVQDRLTGVQELQATIDRRMVALEVEVDELCTLCIEVLSFAKTQSDRVQELSKKLAGLPDIDKLSDQLVNDAHYR